MSLFLYFIFVGNGMPRWTKEETEILEKFYPSTRYKELIQLLPNRTWEAIKKKAQLLGLKVERTDFPKQVWKIGKAGEDYAKRYLKRKGFHVCAFPSLPFKPYQICPHIKCKHIPRIHNYLKSKPKEFCEQCLDEGVTTCWVDLEDGWIFRHTIGQGVSPAYCVLSSNSICNRFCSEKCLTRMIDSLTQEKSSRPDFICHKNGINYFVEVKTGSGKFRAKQKEFLMKVKEKLGIIPMVIHLQIKNQKTKRFRIESIEMLE